MSCSNNNPSAPQSGNTSQPKPTSAIEVTSPPRGGMVQSGTFDVSLLDATGSACDSVSTLTSLSVDGQPVTLTGAAPCFDFSTQLNSRWGLNIITGTAHNQAGAASTFAQSYLRSPQFSAAAAAAKATSPARAAATAQSVPDGFYVQLNQPLIDDNNRNDVDDIATLVDRVLNGTDLNTLLPTTLVNTYGTHTCDCVYPLDPITVYNTSYRVTRGHLTYGVWAVYGIQVNNGHLDVDISLYGPISAPLSVQGWLDPTCVVACVDRSPGITATVTGTVHADLVTVRTSADVKVQNGVPVVTLCQGCGSVNLVNPQLDIDWGPLQFL
ncbi:MAG TPA: hypothetical protein VFH88_10740, partial [Candidatus Krumholzibacteria bacterium]|nr:hypothetical protein [Candidatus Krumholzibacteria bacterium]